MDEANNRRYKDLPAAVDIDRVQIVAAASSGLLRGSSLGLFRAKGFTVVGSCSSFVNRILLYWGRAGWRREGRGQDGAKKMGWSAEGVLELNYPVYHSKDDPTLIPRDSHKKREHRCSCFKNNATPTSTIPPLKKKTWVQFYCRKIDPLQIPSVFPKQNVCAVVHLV